ncbi:Clp protease [Kitasatospora sp. MMS16-BH015]|uniref:Clp protease N-terminal domain-containing protein n=1 Tax=Kitasatospora sp. MMS16-BH015 TaxID=2018025 RepID=UPI000CA3C6D0|nr:Clp protease N-terminal domain-containing protein [Kitasatospora sp. MMS16-BH015]AUG79947.1 Clp protease [Kitasatospora sp. MMS16-BH015]
MFERFTDGARRAVAGAGQEAVRLRHERIGTGHLLLGVLALPEDPAARVLRAAGLDLVTARGALARLLGAPHPAVDEAALASVGVDLAAVREAVEAGFGADGLAALAAPAGPPARRRRGPVRFGEREKRVLALALGQVTAERGDRIEARHLVLGILAEGGGPAVRLLSEAGVDLAELELALRAVHA